MKIELKMLKLRPEMKSGVLCAWNVKEGDTVSKDQVIYEIETDKVVTEIEANADMRIVKLLAEEGDEIECGETIAIAETEASSD